MHLNVLLRLYDHVHHPASITCLSCSSLPPAVWPGRRELWPLFHPPSSGSHPSRPGGHHEPRPRRVRGLFLHKPRIPRHGSPELRATPTPKLTKPSINPPIHHILFICHIRHEFGPYTYINKVSRTQTNPSFHMHAILLRLRRGFHNLALNVSTLERRLESRGLFALWSSLY